MRVRTDNLEPGLGLELAGIALTLGLAALDPALAPGLDLAALEPPVLAPLVLALPLERALFFISGGKLQPAVLVVGALRFCPWRRVASVPELAATPQRRAPIRLHAGPRAPPPLWPTLVAKLITSPRK